MLFGGYVSAFCYAIDDRSNVPTNRLFSFDLILTMRCSQRERVANVIGRHSDIHLFTSKQKEDDTTKRRLKMTHNVSAAVPNINDKSPEKLRYIDVYACIVCKNNVCRN